MIGYIVRRLLFALSMVWGVSFGTFCAFGLSFDPLWQFNIGGSQAIREKRELAAQFHLNAPILERYWLWLGELVRHGFVRWDNQPLNSPLLHAASVTAQLLAVSLVLVGVFSVLFGTITARLAGTPLDWLLRTLGYVAWAIPAFLVATLLVRGLSGTRWFNVGHADGGIGGWIRWISLPSLAVSVGLVGVYGRYLRSAMLISLRQPYADTARAKGISEARLLVRHALRNSSIPFVSVLSLDLASVVGWTLAIDYVFGMRGLAEYFFNALNVQADPNTMTAVLVVVAAIVAICTLVGDLAVGLLDPRIRAES